MIRRRGSMVITVPFLIKMRPMSHPPSFGDYHTQNFAVKHNPAQCLLVGNSFGDLPRAPKAMGAAREAASSAQSNGSVGSLDRSRSMLWARSATSLALGAERRGRIERSMHQTWRVKRVNGTAYPDFVASSWRDPSGAEVARLEESSNDSESIFRSRDGKAPSEGEAEGSAGEAAGGGGGRFG